MKQAIFYWGLAIVAVPVLAVVNLGILLFIGIEKVWNRIKNKFTNSDV